MSNGQNASCEKGKRLRPLSKVQEIVEIRIDQRLDVFNKVKQLQAKDISKRKIARDLGISRNTVHSYFPLESLPSRISSKSTNIELLAQHIVARLNDKGYMMKDIIDEIYELGYNGCRTQAYHNIKSIKEKFKNTHLISPKFKNQESPI